MEVSKGISDSTLLSDKEKSLIMSQETYRYEIKQSLESRQQKPAKAKLLTFLNSSFGLWFLSTCVVGSLTFSYSRFEQNKQKEADAKQLEIVKKQNEIEEARKNASIVAVLLPYIVSEHKNQWEIAFNISEYLRKKGALPDELKFSLLAFENDSTNKTKADAATKVLDVLPIVPNKEKEIISTAIQRQLPPRIYLQIANADQRPKAKAVEAKLEANGFVIPGIENVGKIAHMPPITEVRYYRDEEKSEATSLIGLLQKEGIEVNSTPQKVRSGGEARPRHYELWFSNSF
ncbi:MAG: hypothetical protein JWQ09_1528 [Segetibacter sp.]|nr:hypothetical protein [Segetibacter sp.]